MPLYGFECEECNTDFEELVMSASKIDKVNCPQCTSSKVHKKLSRVAALSSNGNNSYVPSQSCAPSG